MPELPLSPGGRRYGWIRTPRDHRAFGISSVPNLKLAAPPPNDYHLAEFMPPVKDQQSLGACTAYAGSEDREATARQYEGKSPILSAIMLYYLERQQDGSLSQGDCGSTGQTSCTALQTFGICLESQYISNPNDPAALTTAPTPAQLQEALAWKDGAYHSIFTVEDLKTCINSGYRFRLGMNVFQSFESIGTDGLMTIPDPNQEQLLGGHEILGYAYDDTIKGPGSWHAPGAFVIRNSWSSGWGKDGDFLIPYELLAIDSVLQPDYRIQHLGPPWVPAATK